MQRRSKEEAGILKEVENEDDEVKGGGLTVETERTEEEAAEILDSALGMDVDGERERDEES